MYCLRLTGIGNLLRLDPGTEGVLVATRRLVARAFVRRFGLAALFLPLPAKSTNSVCLILPAFSLSMSFLLTWSSNRWIRLQNWTYCGLDTFPARQRVFALLTSSLVAAFRCCVHMAIIGHGHEAPKRKFFLLRRRLRALFGFAVLRCFRPRGSVSSNTALLWSDAIHPASPLRIRQPGRCRLSLSGTAVYLAAPVEVQ